MIAEGIEPETVYRFISVTEAVEAAAAYERSLLVPPNPGKMDQSPISDQDHACVAFVLEPLQTTASPLVLLGGMGPLAGIQGFQHACAVFGHSRAVVLLQACGIPDRTPVIKAAVEGEAAGQREQMGMLLALALEAACRLTNRKAATLDWLILCNSAHFFVPQMTAWLTAHRPDLSSRLRHHSIVEGGVRAMADFSKPVLLLSTTGSQRAGLYRNAAVAASQAFFEPGPILQQWLMTAIYQGVKGSSQEAVIRHGSRFFEAILKSLPNVGAILAGCTEIPEIVALLRAQPPQQAMARLAELPIIDPVLASLRQMARA